MLRILRLCDNSQLHLEISYCDLYRETDRQTDRHLVKPKLVDVTIVQYLTAAQELTNSQSAELRVPRTEAKRKINYKETR